ncbi:Rieske 2Fe-2S domain-containing protein [Picrophilus oshimae]|uniref:Rieske iron-sulfur protein n=1 Tax=Picrophilus torridus (strain ATCC 700027 / DSM 9790 / JCM 10055 / NBRC 100828 / KAW 2/3) TaxID=1122961 RepID=Q6KZY4_PICTO|nr:ubiquinol-cytochrome c reductase iron-sulfur subunit [Picrophilus oshimae]AAT43718.1 Rieske iron-sulfur protein [Picrophilus oshimae DSM 9789]
MRPNKEDIPEPERRAFIKGAGLSIAALFIGGLSIERYAVPKDRNIPVMDSYPLAILEDPNGNPIKASEIPAAEPSSTSYPIMVFNYPLQDEPTFLIKLKGIKITPTDGIIYNSSDNTSIIALSAICQHLGCVPPFLDYHPGESIPFEAKLIGYNKTNWPKYGLIYCKCHGSQYDPSHGYQNLYNNGPAPSPANHSLPQIMLATDDQDYVYAYGINSKNAVIRTHLWYPGGEVHGPEVIKENLSGGTPIRESRMSVPSSLSSITASRVLYKTTVVSSSNGPWPGSF